MDQTATNRVLLTAILARQAELIAPAQLVLAIEDMEPLQVATVS